MRRAAHRAAHASARVFSEFLEVREYTLKPDAVATFLQLTHETVHLRLRMPFLAMFTTEAGGALTRVTHLYLYDDLVRRERVRVELAATKEWAVDYLSASRACVSHQSSILVGVPADAAGAARDLAESGRGGGGGGGGGGSGSPPGCYEYSLLTSTSPRGSTPDSDAPILSGLGGRLAIKGSVLAGPRPGTRLRVWRFDDVDSAVGARLAADGGGDAHGAVTRQLLKPLPFSPWQ